MPWTVRYAPHGAHARFSRNVTCADAMRLNEELFAHDYMDGALRFLVYNHLDVDDFRISTGDIIRTADQHKDFLQGRASYAVAIVLTSSFIYGLGRMWQLLMEQAGVTCRIFATVEEAKAWLLERGAVGEAEFAQLL